ncbi:MAG: type II toxin-antitoxin system RelE/ParE family toxin [Rhodocyclaceae bacterium]|jgi:putative addiction module killer protein|nr:type II toxin-antitoxin system RelE/ParE family toxin [Rhodocyclaceae bacterium]
MFEIRKSDTYEQWFRKLKDRQAQTRINARIRRIEITGNFGDVKPAREGVSELRIDYGPGYRIYFMQRGSVWVVLLAGGDKSTQDTDIKTAIKIAKEWKD